MSTSVSSVSSHFPTAQNGFTTSLASTIASGATTVPLNSVAGYTNGQIAVFVVDPSDVTKKQTFTGVIDTSGVQVTSVIWTAGTNQTHSGGATVVDYATATHISMMTKGLLVEHTQAGAHVMTSPKVITGINDTNGNELLKVTATGSAVNELTLANAATGNSPSLTASGGDSNIGVNFVSKGTGAVKANGNPIWQYLGSATYSGGTVTSSGATPTLVTSLTVNVTIPSGATVVRITAQLQNLYLQTGDALGLLDIFSGATSGALTTRIGQTNSNLGTGVGNFGVVNTSLVALITSPSAGAIYYSAAISASASNAKTDSSATAPALIIVECC